MILSRRLLHTAATSVAATLLFTAWTASASASTVIKVPYNVRDVSCANLHLCVAATTGGAAVMTTDPGAQRPTWVSRDVSGALDLMTISCQSAPFCLALDDNGAAYTTFLPSPDEWRGPVQTEPRLSLAHDVACPTVRLCVGVGRTFTKVSPRLHSGMKVWVDPTGWAPSLRYPSFTWTGVAEEIVLLRGVACPSETLCVAVGDGGQLVVSSDPTDPESWSAARMGDAALTGVSCSSSRLCAVVDERGGVRVATDPAAGPTGFGSPVAITEAPLATVSCPRDDLCVAADTHGTIFVATQPSVLASWHQVAKASTGAPGGSSYGFQYTASCTPDPMCVVTGGWQATGSADPATLSSWRTFSVVPGKVPTLQVAGTPEARRSGVRFRAVCSGPGVCRGRATVTVRHRPTIVARRSFTVKDDTLTHTVDVPLGRIGRRLLQRYGRLKTTLTVTAPQGGQDRTPAPTVVVRRARVTLSTRR